MSARPVSGAVAEINTLYEAWQKAQKHGQDSYAKDLHARYLAAQERLVE